jgi:hypothetical protein
VVLAVLKGADMENIEEVEQAEAHLMRAEAELEAAQHAELTAEIAEKAAVTDIDMAVHELREAEAHHCEIHFTVDGEECETKKRALTANQIISEFGKKDPATSYLVENQGTHKVSYQGKGDQEIKLHDCENFQIVSTGPTPVSDSNGPAAFAAGLRALGYEPTILPKSLDHLFFTYPVEVGRLAGQSVRLGFVVPPDFPNIPPGGPHVSPHIWPINTTSGVPHPAGGVQQSATFQQGAGGEWQYWSRPYLDWGKNRRTVSAYMAHIWRLWETQ